MRGFLYLCSSAFEHADSRSVLHRRAAVLRLRAGDRVLLAGDATNGTLLIYPLSAVHAALSAVHAEAGHARGGEGG